MASWSEIASDFDIDFGKVVAKPVSQRRVKNRGFFSNLGDGILNIGSKDVTKSVAFPITVSKPGVTKNIVDNEE